MYVRLFVCMYVCVDFWIEIIVGVTFLQWWIFMTLLDNNSHCLIYVCMNVCMYVCGRRLLGHSDVDYSLAMDGKCSLIISGSHNQVSHLSVCLYTYIYLSIYILIIHVCMYVQYVYMYHSSWKANIPPRAIQRRGSAGFVSVTDTTGPHHTYILTSIHTYMAPQPFKYAYNNTCGPIFWMCSESEGFSIAPHFRSMIVTNLFAGTSYQVRVMYLHKYILDWYIVNLT